jgi:hypothetical protein
VSAFITATAKGCIVILFGIAAAPGCQGTMVWLSLSRTADVDPAVHVEVRLDGTLAKTYTLIPVDPPAIKRIDIERSAAVVTIKERALVADHVVAQITAEWSGGTFLWIVGAPGTSGSGGANGDAGGAGLDAPSGEGASGSAGASGQTDAGDAGDVGPNDRGAGDTPCPSDAIVVHTCAEYCGLVIGNSRCSVLYPAGDCLATCESFGWRSNSVVPHAEENTLECRIETLGGCYSQATTAGGSAAGGKICPSNPCTAYCDALDRNCAGAPHPYAGSRSGCMAACGGFAWKNDGILIATGAVLDCFLYWAGQAGRADTAADENARVAACQNAGPNSLKCTNSNP